MVLYENLPPPNAHIYLWHELRTDFCVETDLVFPLSHPLARSPREYSTVLGYAKRKRTFSSRWTGTSQNRLLPLLRLASQAATALCRRAVPGTPNDRATFVGTGEPPTRLRHQ